MELLMNPKCKIIFSFFFFSWEKFRWLGSILRFVGKQRLMLSKYCHALFSRKTEICLWEIKLQFRKENQMRQFKSLSLKKCCMNCKQLLENQFKHYQCNFLSCNAGTISAFEYRINSLLECEASSDLNFIVQDTR